MEIDSKRERDRERRARALSKNIIKILYKKNVSAVYCLLSSKIDYVYRRMKYVEWGFLSFFSLFADTKDSVEFPAYQTYPTDTVRRMMWIKSWCSRFICLTTSTLSNSENSFDLLRFVYDFEESRRVAYLFSLGYRLMIKSPYARHVIRFLAKTFFV